MKKHIAISLLSVAIVAACSGAESQPIPEPMYKTVPSPDAGVVDTGVVDAGPDTSVSCSPESDSTMCRRYAAACGAVIATDNCGATRTVLSCGSCQATMACNNGACTDLPCVPASDKSVCATANMNCGVASLVDNCGVVRNTDCGPVACGGPAFTCTDHRCVACTPTTDAALCVAAGNPCGPLSVVDNCGVARVIAECGAVSLPSKCDGFCGIPSPGKCCVPVGCGPLTCGAISDGCGHTISCGANAGNCTGTDTCTNNKCVPVGCIPASDASICLTANKDCGVPAVVDNCGVVRNPVCGPSVCGKGFSCTNNKCTACVPKVCAAGACGLMSDGCTPAPLDCGVCAGGKACNAGVCAP